MIKKQMVLVFGTTKNLQPHKNKVWNLTVRFLVTCTSTRTAEFLWFCATRISNEKRSIIFSKLFFKFTTWLFINIFVVKGNKSFSHSLTNSINLWNKTTTGNTDLNIQVSESFFANNEKRFLKLQSEDFRLQMFEWTTINLDEAISFLCISDSGSILLKSKTMYEEDKKRRMQ